MCRKQNIKEIIDRILTLKLTHPIRVGVSGITASGKTTFANYISRENVIHNQKYMYSLLLIVIILV
ncbi:Uridine kinase [Bacillus cereus]|nr:Uridine kinase [Bacillus cereus]